jgi:uncharacterized membrane protein YkvA (DUF1232 family)
LDLFGDVAFVNGIIDQLILRKQVISWLSQHVKTRHLLLFQPELDSDDDSVKDELDVAFANAFVTATSSCYLGWNVYRKSS